MRLLLVEDNPKVAEGIRTALQRESITVEIAARGHDGEEMGAANAYEVIVLDLILPDRDGVDVCRALRRRRVATPILMLTALSDLSDCVTGLDAGADDYLTKPFELSELSARIRALARRASMAEPTVLEYGGLRLDLAKRVATRGDVTVPLSAREFALLELLMRRPETALPRSTIGEQVWDRNYEQGSNVIDVYIAALRRKIDRGHEPKLIHTVTGVGYRFGTSGCGPAESAGERGVAHESPG